MATKTLEVATKTQFCCLSSCVKHAANHPHQTQTVYALTIKIAHDYATPNKKSQPSSHQTVYALTIKIAHDYATPNKKSQAFKFQLNIRKPCLPVQNFAPSTPAWKLTEQANQAPL